MPVHVRKWLSQWAQSIGVLGLNDAVQTYNPDAFWRYFRWRPLTLSLRSAVVVAELGFIGVRVYLKQSSIHNRAVHFRQALSRLGPAYIKLGQALSTRPDLVPAQVAEELAQLQDKLRSVPFAHVCQTLENELGKNVLLCFREFPSEPVAAASLGQVHKARLEGNVDVAVKVQRPGLGRQLALDALILRTGALAASRIRRSAGTTDYPGLVDHLVGRIFEEADYRREAEHMQRFRRLFAERDTRSFCVSSPRLIPELSSRSVLTMEWLEGVKLTEAEQIRRYGLDAQSIINMGVRCSLHQLLDAGFMHADPHPGNLMAALDGSLVYFDFGACLQMAPKQRIGLLRGLVNYVNRDGNALASDLLVLGFIPSTIKHAEVATALEEAFQQQPAGANFLDAVRHIAQALRGFEFQMPSYYARLIRALASLEGTAKRLDPSFQVFSRAYPYVLSQVLSDKSDEMRRVLASMIVTDDGHIRWERISRLLMLAVDENTSSTKGSNTGQSTNTTHELEAMQESIVEALDEAVEYIASNNGAALRKSLANDISSAVDSAILQPRGSTVFDSAQASQAISSVMKLISGAPNIWVPLLFRVASHRGTRAMLSELAATLRPKLGQRGREALVLALSSPLRMV